MSDSKFADGGRGRPNHTADDDDEFNYGDAYDPTSGGRAVAQPSSARSGGAVAGMHTQGLGSTGTSTRLRNQPFDEAEDVDDEFDESIDTHALSSSNIGSPPQGRGGKRGGPAPASHANTHAQMDSPPSGVESSLDMRGEYASDSELTHGAPGAAMSARGSSAAAGGAASAHVGLDEDAAARAGGSGGASAGMPGRMRSESLVDDSNVPTIPQANTIAPGMLGIPDRKNTYNPSDFAALQVPDEVRELFEYIGRYKPATIELEAKLKCFIPEYVPAIGDVDPFLKPPRPDGKEETLGLTNLDEPAPTQSDPTVLDLQLRALSKKAGVEPLLVRSIEYAEKNPKEIAKWVASIEDLHKSKPPPQVHYTKPMPDTEHLMQEWPPEFEQLLKELQLPAADTELSLEEYARVVCALLDVPVYGSLVQSLHVVFTLYNDFKGNQHFANILSEELPDAGGKAGALA